MYLHYKPLCLVKSKLSSVYVKSASLITIKKHVNAIKSISDLMAKTEARFCKFYSLEKTSKVASANRT